MCSTPVLAFPDFSLPFILDTDASQSGIGTALSQEEGGEKKVIAYANQTLTKVERRYSVTTQELLAVVAYIHTPLQVFSTRKTVCAENGLWQPTVATYL